MYLSVPHKWIGMRQINDGMDYGTFTDVMETHGFESIVAYEYAENPGEDELVHPTEVYVNADRPGILVTAEQSNSGTLRAGWTGGSCYVELEPATEDLPEQSRTDIETITAEYSSIGEFDRSTERFPVQINLDDAGSFLDDVTEDGDWRLADNFEHGKLLIMPETVKQHLESTYDWITIRNLGIIKGLREYEVRDTAIAEPDVQAD